MPSFRLVPIGGALVLGSAKRSRAKQRMCATLAGSLRCLEKSNFEEVLTDQLREVRRIPETPWPSNHFAQLQEIMRRIEIQDPGTN